MKSQYVRPLEPNEARIVCFFDGCCEPRNPGGNMGMGAVIFIDGKEAATFKEFIEADKANSNNVAEYTAFLWILTTLENMGLHEEAKFIYGDSKLVIEQMLGNWRIKFGRYVLTAKICKKQFEKFKNTHLQWIPREYNKYADELSKAELVKNNVEFKIQPQ